MPTKRPEIWPTVYDYLTENVKGIKHAIAKNHVEHYRKAVPQHQDVMIKLFERMVADEVAKYATKDEASDAILKKGWNWFKFSTLVMRFDNHVWIPRIHARYMEIVAKDAFFTADELRDVFEAKLDKVDAAELLTRKKERPTNISKGVGGTLIGNYPANNANFVNDWTQEIFK